MAFYEDFSSLESTLEFIRDRADDIEAAIIPQAPAISLTRQGAPYAQFVAGMVLHLLDGNYRMLTPEAAEVILNDGILNRMRVKITLFRGQVSMPPSS